MLKKFLLLLLIFSSYLFGAEKVYAWGYGDLIVETLKVVKYMFEIGEFKDFWKVAVLISLITAALMMLTPNPDYFKIPKVFFLSIGIYTIFITSKIDIVVDDKANNANSATVTQVPWAVGYPLAFFSTLEYRLGVTYETATSIPNGMKYSDSGFFTPVSIFSQAIQHKIITPYIYQNLSNYIDECVIPDLENGYKDYRNLVDSDNLWAYMGNTSPATFLFYTKEDNSKELITCTTAYTNINATLNNYASVTGDGMEYLGKTLGMLNAASVASKLGTVNQYLLNNAKTASQMLIQSAAINTFSSNFRNYANINGADVKNTAFHAATASQASSAQMIISGILGSKYIPVIKGILTTIIVGLTPILALMMVTPMGFKTLIGYILILSWLVCWHFGDVILNHIMTTKVQSALNSLGDVKFNTIGLINSTTTDYINMAASMYWTIPTIAFLVVTGFSLSAFASLNNAMTSKLDRTSSAVGGDMAKGNANFGNVSHNTYSANKVSAVSDTIMGNSFKMEDTSVFNQGSQANRFNNLSNTSGTQAFGGGFDTSWTNSALSKDLGKGYDFNIGDQNTRAIAGGKHQATSAGSVQAISSDGRELTANLDSGNIYTKDSSGNLNLYTGKASIADNGKTIDIEYKDGQEFKRTITDLQGNKTEATTMENGVDKSFNIKTFDGNTNLSGEYYARSNTAKILDGKLNGVDINKLNSSNVIYSSSTVKNTLEELGILKQNENSKSKQNSEDNSITTSDKNAGSAEVSASGGFKVFGTGVSAKIATAKTIEMSDNNTVKITNSNGETEKISLTESEKETLQKSLQKNATAEEKMATSRDLTPKVMENIINNGLQNNVSIIESVISMNRNKDNIYNENQMQVANSSQVSNNLNNQDLKENYKNLSTNAELEQLNKNQLIRASGYASELENLVSQKGNVVVGKENEYNKLYETAKFRSNDGQTKTINNVVDTNRGPLKSSLTIGHDEIKENRNNALEKALNNGYIHKNSDGKYQVSQGQEDNIRSQMSISEIRSLADNRILNNKKGDGYFEAEPALYGIKETAKLVNPNQNQKTQNQPIEEVKDRK